MWTIYYALLPINDYCIDKTPLLFLLFYKDMGKLAMKFLIDLRAKNAGIANSCHNFISSFLSVGRNGKGNKNKGQQARNKEECFHGVWEDDWFVPLDVALYPAGRRRIYLRKGIIPSLSLSSSRRWVTAARLNPMVMSSWLPGQIQFHPLLPLSMVII